MIVPFAVVAVVQQTDELSRASKSKMRHAIFIGGSLGVGGGIFPRGIFPINTINELMVINSSSLQTRRTRLQHVVMMVNNGAERWPAVATNTVVGRHLLYVKR